MSNRAREGRDTTRGADERRLRARRIAMDDSLISEGTRVRERARAQLSAFAAADGGARGDGASSGDAVATTTTTRMPPPPTPRAPPSETAASDAPSSAPNARAIRESVFR